MAQPSLSTPIKGNGSEGGLRKSTLLLCHISLLNVNGDVQESGVVGDGSGNLR